MIDDFEETIVMESSPGYEETFNSSSENESSSDRGNSSETAQMGSGHQNPSAIKADYEGKIRRKKNTARMICR